MENTCKLVAPALIALGLFMAACGSASTPTPRVPPPTATPPVRSTAVPEQRPSPTPAPPASPVAVVPTNPPPEATTIPSGKACTNQYAYVSDVSIPDGTSMNPGQVFTKTWRVRNTGTCIWGEGYTLACVRGQAMTSLSSVAVPRTEPGSTADLSVLMTAPTASGTYQGYWALTNPGGVPLTPNLWVKIQVP